MAGIGSGLCFGISVAETVVSVTKELVHFFYKELYLISTNSISSVRNVCVGSLPSYMFYFLNCFLAYIFDIMFISAGKYGIK
jgi:hypothetical protein